MSRPLKRRPPETTTFFPTCVVEALKPEVGLAAARVLQRTGTRVEVSDEATCCGQPAWNAGHAGAAARVARTTLHALDDTDAEAIVVPAGSCATMIRVFWRELFEVAGTERDRERAERVARRTWEFAEFLSAVGLPGVVRRDPTPTAVHRSCHMVRELGLDEEPDRLLDAAGTERTPSAGEERCCGFGGLFSVKLPEVSVAMADERLDAIAASGASRVVGCDASCLLHLQTRARRRGLPLGFLHLAEVLDDALGEGP